MRLVLDRALFAPQSGQEAGELLRLFTAALDDVVPHAVQTDPPYVLGADNQEIDAWLARRHAEEAGALQAVLAQGNVLASGVRGAASVDPAPLPSWRLAGGFDVRVERRAASDWGALQLTLADAIDLLREPVHLVLENEFNDLAFVCHLAGPTLGPVLRQLHAAAGRLHVHGGGGGQGKNWLEALIKPPLTAAKCRRALRAWVLFDQDSGDPDARDPSRTAVDMMILCEQVHAAFPAGLTWSCLRRREIESYVPDVGLQAEATAAHGAMVQQIIDWRRDPALAPLAWAFDLKLGLRGDLRSRLPQATRDAVKQRTLALDATMLKVPFDALGPAEVAALDSGLGKNRINEALKADPPLGWTSDIPAEYDRGPPSVPAGPRPVPLRSDLAMERKMFDTPVLPRLATILAEVKSGDLVVPRFQRPFVWDDDRRLQLLDSITQGMPIGSLLVWRTSRRDLETYERVGGIRLERARQGDEKVNYLLDGHQRISTLFGALQSGEREPPGKDDDTRWPLFYELGAKDRPAFRIAPRRGAPPAHWLPLDILLDGDALFDFTQRLRLESKRDLAREAENLANIFRDYIIPIVPLVTEELDTVTDAFVRINSQGKGMTEAHMLRALTHLKTIDTDQRFSEVRARLQVLGWGGLDDQVLVNVLKAMLGLDVYASNVRRVRGILERDSKPLDALASAVEEAVEALSAIGICGPPALPYVYQLVTLAAIAARFPGRLGEPAVRDNLRRWFWITTYTEHFTGITGNRIRDTIEDLAHNLWGPPIKADLAATVELTPTLWLPSVRARAFLLFLAQLPTSETARLQRQQLLGMDDARAAPLLYPDRPSSDPANRVIAAPAELRELRAALRNGQSLTPDLADELGIPEEAVRALPDRDAFLGARRDWLFRRENAFIESFAEDAPSLSRDAGR